MGAIAMTITNEAKHIHFPEYWNTSIEDILKWIFDIAENGTKCAGMESLLKNWFGNELNEILESAQIIIWFRNRYNFTETSEHKYSDLIQLLFNTTSGRALSYNHITQNLTTSNLMIFEFAFQRLLQLTLEFDAAHKISNDN